MCQNQSSVGMLLLISIGLKEVKIYFWNSLAHEYVEKNYFNKFPQWECFIAEINKQQVGGRALKIFIYLFDYGKLT